MDNLSEDQMVVVATKVSKESKSIIDAICEKLNITVYDLMQMCLDAIIRYTSDQFNLSEELNKLIRLFDGMKDWEKSITLTDPLERQAIVGAFYILAEAHKKGQRLVYVDSEVCGQRYASENVQEMFEMLMNILLPKGDYKIIRQLGVELGTSSAFETITQILNEYKTNPDEKTLRDMFDSCDWVGVRHQHDEADRSRRTMVNSMEAFERKQRSIEFDE